jgi:hypothetical protein
MEGKPGSHKESPDQVDGPTKGSVEELGERLEQNQRELTRLAEVEEEEGAPAKTLPNLVT